MLKIYDKPLLKKVAALAKVTAAVRPVASYCDYIEGVTAAVPEECDLPNPG